MKVVKTLLFGKIQQLKSKKAYNCKKCCSYLEGEYCLQIRAYFQKNCDYNYYEKIETAHYKTKRF